LLRYIQNKLILAFLYSFLQLSLLSYHNFFHLCCKKITNL
uniref:Ovule protein n=1 Tax=Brugia timori TaxID=42155 RepID=A0A0R3QBL8_9BILA